MITAAMVRTIYPAVTSNGNFIIAVLGIIKGKVDIAQHRNCGPSSSSMEENKALLFGKERISQPRIKLHQMSG